MSGINWWEVIPAVSLLFLAACVVASFVIVWLEDRDP